HDLRCFQTSGCNEVETICQFVKRLASFVRQVLQLFRPNGNLIAGLTNQTLDLGHAGLKVNSQSNGGLTSILKASDDGEQTGNTQQLSESGLDLVEYLPETCQLRLRAGGVTSNMN